MTSGFTKLRVGHAAVAHKTHAKRDACTTSFYKSPTAGQSVDASAPVSITWDASCLSGTKAVDIYLFDPAAAVPLLHTWQNADFAKGAYDAQLLPRWWNASASVQLQLSIVPAGTPLFLQTLAAAPLWTATYAAPAGGAAPPAADTGIHDTGVTNVAAGAVKKTSSGGVAAAVLLPLLALLGLGAFFWLRRTRARTAAATARSAEDIDRRMSTISRDWAAITPAGASAAIRQSVAFSGVVGGVGMARESTYSFDAGRAGVGAGEMAEVDAPAPARLRPGLRTQAAPADRQSRAISFAEQPRPSDVRRSLASGGRVSADTRRTVTSRAFHDGYVPPLPGRADSYDDSGASAGSISPTQAQGAPALSAADIHARLEQTEMLPALSMMVQGGGGEYADARVLPPRAPAPPAAAHTVTSPDDLLRAYATTRQSVQAPTNAYGMRVLYAPPTPASANPFRASTAQGSDNSAYSAFANEGH